MESTLEQDIGFSDCDTNDNKKINKSYAMLFVCFLLDRWSESIKIKLSRNETNFK